MSYLSHIVLEWSPGWKTISVSANNKLLLFFTHLWCDSDWFLYAGVSKDKRLGSGTRILLPPIRILQCISCMLFVVKCKLGSVLNLSGTLCVGRSYAIYQFLLWIRSYPKFFKVTGCIFLSAWRVRSSFFSPFLIWLCCTFDRSFQPGVLTWDNNGFFSRYTEQSDISRARVWFFEGRRKIMLYTERAHFYFRYKVL